MAERDALSELIAGFVVEAQEIVGVVTRDALALERMHPKDAAATSLLDSLARGLHTLKGTAATLELDGPSALAHEMETAVAPARRGGSGASGETVLAADVVGALLSSLDRYMQLLRTASAAAATTATATTTATTTTTAAATTTTTTAAAATAATADEGWRVQSRQVLALLRDIERLRELQLRLDDKRRAAELTLASLKSGEDVRDRLAVLATELKADAADAGDVVDTLEDGVKAICTEPVRVILQPLTRAVRDLCAAQAKEARLSTVGAEVSINRRVLEALRGPLVHIVRNAIDHGVEMPAEREAAGKHREASIVIRVEQQGNMLFIEVADDGRGVDLQALRATAMRNGMSPTEVAALDEGTLLQLVFRPGFSTKKRVTTTSGRGVGLDVVKSAIRGLRGTVEIRSKRGDGTRLTLMIPAELGSSPVLLVRIAEHTLALPLLAVANVRLAKNDDADAVDAGALLGIRQRETASPGQPVVRLDAGARSLSLLVDEIVGESELVVGSLPQEVADLRAYQGAATLAHGDLVLVLRPDWLVDEAKETDGAGRVGRGRAQKKRALVVDDSLTARALHRSMLEAGGFVVHAVSGARQALSQLAKAAYDVVVSDVQMPEMDGLTLATMVRAMPHGARLPIVLVTAHADADADADNADDRARAIAAGADGWLTKVACAKGGLLEEVHAAMAARRGAA